MHLGHGVDITSNEDLEEGKKMRTHFNLISCTTQFRLFDKKKQEIVEKIRVASGNGCV